VLVALSDPGARLRGRDGELLPARRPCERCGAVISAWALASDRFCWCCAPHVDDEQPRNQALYCKRGHLKAKHWIEIVDRSKPSGVRRRCSECKREDDASRDRSAAGKAARELKRRCLTRSPSHDGSDADEPVPSVREWLLEAGLALERPDGELIATELGLELGRALEESAI
jgi:hypothetical protein